MTQEEKQLLLKDLCGRLPYGVKFQGEDSNVYTLDAANYFALQVEDVVFKPYLRPMSSMTEEEKKDLKKEHLKDEKLYAECLTNAANGDSSMRGKVIPHFAADWCNKNHFDYRGLIPMGLALESPGGMYNKEEPEKGSEIPIPKTVDEAVKTLAKILSKEDRDYLLENGAISMHDSLGRWIRNEWGLWTGSELKDELMNMNKGLNHPDDMSNYIIEEFIKYWNNKL